MTTKKKNDNPNLLKRNALIISIAFNIILSAMFLLLYVPTLKPQPLPTQIPRTPDPFQLTATQLIATATEGAIMRLTITPLPPIHQDVLRERFLDELETELGFTHPILNETVDDFIAAIRRGDGYIQSYRIPDNIIFGVDRITFDDAEYVALDLHYRVSGEDDKKSLIFRIEEELSELLVQYTGTTIHSFSDINGNGFPDIVLQFSYGRGDSITVYEFRSNNEFSNLTENLNASINHLVDLDEDGILELEGTQRLFIPTGIVINQVNRYNTSIPRWFFWNGEAYEPFPTFRGE